MRNLIQKDKSATTSARMERNGEKVLIPAITGEVDESKAIKVFPDWLAPFRTSVIAYSTSLVSTTIGYPLDTLKTRMQTFKHFKSIFDCAKQTYVIDGFCGFYRGIMAPLLSTSITRSLSVSVFTHAKPYCFDVLYGWKCEENSERFPLFKNLPVCFTAGFLAGATVSMFACPFEFTKLYSQIVTLTDPQAHKFKTNLSNQSIAKVVKNIVAVRGIGGLYSGYKYSLMRDAIGSGIYYSVYELFKWTSNSFINGTLAANSPVSILLAGGMSGVTCWAFIFPFDTAKSLVQKKIVANIVRVKKGLKPLDFSERTLTFSRSMYRGVGIQMTRSFVVNMVFFSAYEFGMRTFI